MVCRKLYISQYFSLFLFSFPPSVSSLFLSRHAKFSIGGWYAPPDPPPPPGHGSGCHDKSISQGLWFCYDIFPPRVVHNMMWPMATTIYNISNHYTTACFPNLENLKLLDRPLQRGSISSQAV